jgi:hypothetical protein
MTCQFETEGGSRVRDAHALLQSLEGRYERAYYEGIIWERRGTALMARHGVGSGPVIYGHLREAMACYERAEKLSPPQRVLAPSLEYLRTTRHDPFRDLSLRGVPIRASSGVAPKASAP